jgi:hypothetical protein
VFALWQAGRDPGIQVRVRAPPSAVVGPLALRVSVTTSEAGYLYLVAHRAGSNDLVLWHPRTLEGRQPLEAGAASEIAMSAWAGQAPMPGTWRVMAIVTRQPWDLAADAWQVRGGTVGRVFDGAAAPSAAAACPPGAGPCDGAFGAEEFSVTVEPPSETLPAKPSRPTTGVTKPVERPEAKGKANEECARLIQQMSLGEASAGLVERFKALGCR